MLLYNAEHGTEHQDSRTPIYIRDICCTCRGFGTLAMAMAFWGFGYGPLSWASFIKYNFTSYFKHRIKSNGLSGDKRRQKLFAELRWFCKLVPSQCYVITSDGNVIESTITLLWWSSSAFTCIYPFKISEAWHQTETATDINKYSCIEALLDYPLWQGLPWPGWASVSKPKQLSINNQV